MAQPAGASFTKAFFTNLTTKAVFHVQFNPKEFKLDEKANWKASEEHQTHKPLLTYEKGDPTTLTMDLVFDCSDNGDNVNEKFVMPLRDFLTCSVTETDAQSNTTKHPPFVLFTWGSFQFDCVVEKVSCTFLMFKGDGTPIRAKVQVGLKERNRNVTGGSGDDVTLTTAGSVFTGASTSAFTTTVMQGDTLDTVANRVHGEARFIALANNIADPMNLRAGATLVVPANAELAAILAHQSLRRTQSSWKSDHSVQPFDHHSARAGDTSNVPSAFDEDGPVGMDYAAEPGGLAKAHASFGGSGGGGGGGGGHGQGQGGFVLTGKDSDSKENDSDFAFGQNHPSDGGQGGHEGGGQGHGEHGGGQEGAHEGKGEQGGQGSHEAKGEQGGQGSHEAKGDQGDQGDQGGGDQGGGGDKGGGDQGGGGDKGGTDKGGEHGGGDKGGTDKGGEHGGGGKGEHGGGGKGEHGGGDGGGGGGGKGGGGSDEHHAKPKAEAYDEDRGGTSADSVRHTASPDAQGAKPTAQGYDHGASGAASQPDAKVEYGGGGGGGGGGSSAEAVRHAASPDAQGAKPTAESYTHSGGGSAGGPAAGSGGSGGSPAVSGAPPAGGISLTDAVKKGKDAAKPATDKDE